MNALMHLLGQGLERAALGQWVQGHGGSAKQGFPIHLIIACCLSKVGPI